MATIPENEKIWNENYGWQDNGDEWSIPWGGVSMQWHTMLLPRIHKFVPTGNLLEIACGRGRWTNFLKDISNSLIGVDLSETNIEFCKNRFKDCKNTKFYKNDGKSLEFIEDNCIDFIFSCDSLVHVNIDVMEGYLSQFDRILKPNGIAFIHHSNTGEYKNNLPKDMDLHFRDESVDAKSVEILAQKYNLMCISQEKVQWISKTKHFIDCFSVVVKQNSIHSRKNRVFKNKNFQKEIKNSFLLSNLYSENIIKIDSIKNLLYVLDASLGSLNLPIEQILKAIKSPYNAGAIKTFNNYIKKHSAKDLTPIIVNHLIQKNINEIIVYGAGDVFEKLEKHLKKTNIKILHLIDKKAEKKEFVLNSYKVKSKNSLLKSNAPIIVASIAFADEITKNLENYKKENALENEIYDLHRCLK